MTIKIGEQSMNKKSTVHKVMSSMIPLGSIQSGGVKS